MSELLYNVATGQWEAARTPTVYKDVNAADVSVERAIWTPAAGKRFRLMGGMFMVSGNFNGQIVFRDGTGGTRIMSPWANGANTNVMPIFFTLPANGYLSTAINNILTANAGVALAVLSGVVWGTEE